MVDDLRNFEAMESVSLGLGLVDCSSADGCEVIIRLNGVTIQWEHGRALPEHGWSTTVYGSGGAPGLCSF